MLALPSLPNASIFEPAISTDEHILRNETGTGAAFINDAHPRPERTSAPPSKRRKLVGSRQDGNLENEYASKSHIDALNAIQIPITLLPASPNGQNKLQSRTPQNRRTWLAPPRPNVHSPHEELRSHCPPKKALRSRQVQAYIVEQPRSSPSYRSHSEINVFLS